MKRFRYHMAVVLLLLTHLAGAQAEVLVVDDDFSKLRIKGTEAFMQFPDISDSLTSWPRQHLFTNFRKDSLYCALDIRNDGNAGDNTSFVVACEAPGIPFVGVYQYLGDSLISSGEDGIWKQPKRATRLIEFPIEVPVGETHRIFIKAHGDGFRMRVPIVLYSADRLTYARPYEIVIFTVYFTILFLILVTNFFVDPALQSSLRWPYIIYCLVLATNMALIFGMGYQLIWFKSPLFQLIGEPLFINLIFLSAIGYQRRLFNTKRRLPNIDFFISVLIGLALVATVATLFRYVMPAFLVPYYQWGTFFVYNTIIAVTSILPVYQWLRYGFKEALVFFVASFGHAIAFGIYAYESMGLLFYPGNFFISFWTAVSWLNFVMALIILWHVNLKIRRRNLKGQEVSEKKIKLIRELLIQDELERERVGADLHDEAGSRFASVKILLSGLLYEIQQQNSEPQQDTATLDRVISEVDLLCQSNRALSHRLLSGSLQRLGIDDALTQLQQRLLNKGRFVSFQYPPLLFSGTGETFQYLVYRILEELVEEVYKEADHFRVRIDAIPGREALQLRAEGVDEPLPEPDEALLQELRTRVAVFSEHIDETVTLESDVLELRLPILYD